MADYDFRSLSPHDFELLSRDLLQKVLGVRLESFTTGRDSGIDFRFRNDTQNVIVQCKHYAESGFEALLRAMAGKERKKLEKLAPTRYFLTTSVGLTPARKQQLVEALSPFVQSPGEIYGKDDLNNLLTQHPDVETSHFKLWLTSTGVLERLLKNVFEKGIADDTQAHLERIRLRLSRYVPNPSFGRSREVLDKTHFCIIAGIPGIGKTTLAEVLLADLVDRHGFTAFRVSHDLSELLGAKNPKARQVFYFDDFLGKTSLEKLQKNEDQRLVELMQEVSANPNWRFILTTREYILNMAKAHYEAFAQPPIEFAMCIVKLDDYTRSVRAKILYNHIYFARIPREYKLAILANEGYEKIVGHRNYNPRVIDYMTQMHHAGAVSVTMYLTEFVDSLDNPARIWDHAFRNQISEASRHLLLVLTTLGDQMRLDLLEKAFWEFFDFRHKKFGFPMAPRSWEEALKELDGNFIKTEKVGKDVIVSFHTPSVRDFMEAFLDHSDADVLDLLRGAVFYEQYTNLWAESPDERYPAIRANVQEFVIELHRGLWKPSARTIRTLDFTGEVKGMNRYDVSNESRVAFFIQAVDDAKHPDRAALVDTVLAAVEQHWNQGKGDHESVVVLLKLLSKQGLTEEQPMFLSARRLLLASPETGDEFKAAADFYARYPKSVSISERELLRKQFKEFATSHPDADADDPDIVRGAIDEIEYVGKRLGVETDEYIQDLLGRADELESERAGDEPDSDYDEWRASRDSGDDVAAMFGGLEGTLKDE